MTPTRRTMLMAGGLSLAAGAADAERLSMQSNQAPAPIDEGTARGGHVSFSPIHAESEAPDAQPPNPDPPARRVGFAVLGLGRLALENILPAFGECKHARLAGLISGDAEKVRIIAAQYGIDPASCYGYQDLDRMRDNPAVEAVYVVTPNAFHRDATVKAAVAGKHVLSEKPMAANVEQAEEMVSACRKAQRLLMVAYRCQYEPNNVELRRRARNGELGKIQFVDAINTQNQGDPSQWRQRKALAGGGSLPDVGLYCLNTTRALLGEEPIEVSAMIHSPEGDPRFREVESSVSFTLRFPSGVIANCASSYSTHEHRNIRVLGDLGTGEVERAFGYEGQSLRLSKRAETAEGTTEIRIGRKNQFALEIDHFADCIRRGVQPRTPGEEGLQDQRIMAAIYESARTGRPVRLQPVPGVDPFRGPEPSA